MFGIKIQGRLGNQLFQYAYAKVLSRKLRRHFFLLNAKEFYAHKYFDIRIETPFFYRLQAARFWLRKLGNVSKIAEDQFQPPEVNIQNERDEGVYIGYYQSERYHNSAIVDEIKNELIVKANYRINIKDYVPDNRPNIVVHVRRTDYITFGGDLLGGTDLTLPLDYYNKALALLPVEECNIVFLSDDIDFVQNNFAYADAIYAKGNPEIVDFQLIMQADYLVLANSSFSWWGAYLNKGVKKIIAPKYWLGIKIKEEYPRGVICSNWITID